jgi:hypothetical protein
MSVRTSPLGERQDKVKAEKIGESGMDETRKKRKRRNSKDIK